MERQLAEMIDGRESFAGSDPRSALAAFYQAFNERDLAAMACVWLPGEEPSMSNPVGAIARGWPAISAVYDRLFAGDTRVQVAFHDYSIHRLADGFIAVGRERGTLVRVSLRLDLAFRTTRIFRSAGGAWRQLHHHGSIDEPMVLERYQSAVR